MRKIMNLPSELTVQQIIDNWAITKPTLYKRIQTKELIRLPNKKILLTEFLRVFPDVKSKSKETESIKRISVNIDVNLTLARLEVENRFLKEKIEALSKREAELIHDKDLFRQLFTDTSERIKLLEAPKVENSDSTAVESMTIAPSAPTQSKVMGEQPLLKKKHWLIRLFEV